MKKTDVKPFLDSLGNIPEHTKRLYANATAELARREMEALRLYEPLPFQQAYHSSTAKEVVLMKSNRAGGSLAGFAEDARAAMGCDPFDVRRSPDVKFSDTPADKCRKLGAPTPNLRLPATLLPPTRRRLRPGVSNKPTPPSTHRTSRPDRSLRRARLVEIGHGGRRRGTCWRHRLPARHVGQCFHDLLHYRFRERPCRRYRRDHQRISSG